MCKDAAYCGVDELSKVSFAGPAICECPRHVPLLLYGGCLSVGGRELVMVDVAVFPSGQWNGNEVSARRLVRPGGTIGALPSKARLRRHDDYS